MAQLNYGPDYVVKPGETLLEIMGERGMSASVMARSCIRLSVEQVVGIIDGSVPITPEIAGDLAVGTGVSARMWLQLERRYRRGLAEGKVDVDDA